MDVLTGVIIAILIIVGLIIYGSYKLIHFVDAERNRSDVLK